MAGLEEKREKRKAEHPEGRRGRGFRRGFRGGARFGFNMAELLGDGVIDSDELAGLPEGHPLTNPDGPFAAAAADGEITQQEIQDVLEQLRAERRSRGPRFGEDASDVEGTSV